MKCSTVRDELSAYLDGEMGERTRVALGDHLRGCPECRAIYEGLQRVSDASRGLFHRADENLGDLAQSRDRCLESVLTIKPSGRRSWFWVWAFGVAVLLAAGVVWWFGRGSGQIELGTQVAEVQRATFGRGRWFEIEALSPGLLRPCVSKLLVGPGDSYRFRTEGLLVLPPVRGRPSEILIDTASLALGCDGRSTWVFQESERTVKVISGECVPIATWFLALRNDPRPVVQGFALSHWAWIFELLSACEGAASAWRELPDEGSGSFEGWALAGAYAGHRARFRYRASDHFLERVIFGAMEFRVSRSPRPPKATDFDWSSVAPESVRVLHQ